MPSKEWTEAQRTCATNGLRVAAERFRENAAVMRSEIRRLGMFSAPLESAAKQFTQQATDSIQLADLIENADSVNYEYQSPELPDPPSRSGS